MTARKRLRRPVAIAAVSEMRPGRYPQLDPLDMYMEVTKQFLREWKIKPGDINGLFAATAGVSAGADITFYTHEKVSEELGFHPIVAETLSPLGSTYSIMIQRAALAIAEGMVDSVLCIAAGKFAKVQHGTAELLAKYISHPEFEWIYGPFIVAINAMAWTRHMALYGSTREQLAQVAVSQRKWGCLHPDAIMKKKGQLTLDAVLNSQMIAWPLTLYDCSVPAEGGAAILVASEEVAKRINPQPAYIHGMGECHTHASISQCPDSPTLGAKKSGEQAFAMAGVSAKDIEVAELYDGFSAHPIFWLEEMGFCKPGQGGRIFQDGRTDPGGDLPVNTFGGLLSFGHTGDSSGMSMIVEGALQVMGKAGERQVPKANLCLVHTFGGMLSEHTTLILGRQS